MVIVLGAVVELQFAFVTLRVQELLQIQMLLGPAMGDDVSVEEQLAHRTVLAHLGVVLGLAHTLQPVDFDRLQLLGDAGFLAEQGGPHAVALLDAFLHYPMGTAGDVILKRGRIVHVLVAHVTVQVLVGNIGVRGSLRLLVVSSIA